MTNPNDLLDQCSVLESRIQDLKNKRNELMDQWCHIVCPFKVGDIVDNAGYSHRGKKAKVTQVFYTTDYKGRASWAVRCVLILKDGSESVLTTKFNQGQWEESKPE